MDSGADPAEDRKGKDQDESETQPKILRWGKPSKTSVDGGSSDITRCRGRDERLLIVTIDKIVVQPE
jgi:hypothetical protein